jgi:hypothetical protein
MSVYFSRFGLNTYYGTPYFQSQIPDGYPLSLVLQKCRAFRRLPKHLKELSVLAKYWAELHTPEDDLPASMKNDIGRWYDSDGNELDPDTGRKLTDEEIDAQWTPDPTLDTFTVSDIPIPDGGFADPEVWEPEETVEESEPEDRPTREQLLNDIFTRGREATADEYGIPIDQLPSDPSVPRSMKPDVSGQKPALDDLS